jgi:hypothetical protein
MWKAAILGSASLLFAGSAWARDAARPTTRAPVPAALEAEIKALQAPKVAWRQIAWQTCLLEGLKEARARRKPVLLWVFIDRPTDDARC